MVRLVAAKTGEGKTTRLIDEANEALKTTKGHIVYVDASNAHMYDLKHEIRYINLKEYPLNDYHEFYGFLCGVLSEDNDISIIYVDSLLKLAHLQNVQNSELLISKLKAITDKFNVQLVASLKGDPSEVPEFLQEFIA